MLGDSASLFHCYCLTAPVAMHELNLNQQNQQSMAALVY